ncbi:ParB-like nuclease domain protein [Mycobacterium phage Dandelion]|uniref:Uncharacterized protein n=1 Tax=Mycobacterium phage Dandelion TaxID=1074305 RepID=G1JW41_9CAUD|nr:ParB-like nuclease domain protein [Mycobacterium phage Dandelion]AEL97759.1 hypothetical protein DANDELION_89 [Mycobacterium phage Dandelion]
MCYGCQQVLADLQETDGLHTAADHPYNQRRHQVMQTAAAGPQKIYRGISVNPWSGGETSDALRELLAPGSWGQPDIDPAKLAHPDLGPALLNHVAHGNWSEWGNFRGKRPQLGRHWTTDKRIAQGFGGSGGITTVLEADHPGDVGLDPKNTGVRGRGDRSNYGHEQEVTLKPGTPLNITHVHVRHPTGWYTHDMGVSKMARAASYEVPEPWQRYYDHMSAQPDTSGNAHLMMPTDLVHHYREYDRDPADPNYQVLKKVIQEHGNQIRQPLVINADDTHGVLTEGNHRAAIARELGITHLPVRVQYSPKAQANEGAPVPHHPAFKQWLDANTGTLHTAGANKSAHPPLSQLWADYQDWHGPTDPEDEDAYTPHDSVQSWGNVESYLQDRHGLSPWDEGYYDHPITFGMAKLHSLAQARPQVDGHDYDLSDDDLVSGAALGLLKIRRNQQTKRMEPDYDFHEGARITAAETPFIARGMSIGLPDDDHDLFHAINEHRATPEHMHRLLTHTDGRAGVWWGTYRDDEHPDPKAYGSFEDFVAHAGMGEDSVAKYHDSGEYHDRVRAEGGQGPGQIFAEVPVVAVGTRPKRGDELWDPDKHNPADSLMGNSYLDDSEPIDLHEVHYNSGRGWVKVPMKGYRVQAARTAGTYFYAAFDPHSETIPGDPDYLYHATHDYNAQDIKDYGHLDVHDPWHGTDQDSWPDGSVDPRSYWTHDPQVARSFYPEGGSPTLLRTKRTNAPFQRERGTGDFYSPAPVSADHLEVYHGGGKWGPLHEW